MLDDEFMWPLVRENPIMASARVIAAGAREFKGDVIVGQVRDAKGLSETDARQAVADWAASKGGYLYDEEQRTRRPTGAMLGSGPVFALVLVLPAHVVPEASD